MAKKLLKLICFGLLLTRAGYGQMAPMPQYNYTPRVPPPNWPNPALYGNNTNPDARKGSGSYQLVDGSWHQAQKMAFDGLRLTVKEEGKKKLVLTAATLHQLEVAQYTFLAVHTLPIDVDASDFSESIFNMQGVQVLRLLGEPRYLLKLPQAPMQLLPNRKKEFKEAMLIIVQGCPALAASIADGTLGHNHIVQIMRRYVACQPSSSAPAK
jgi:hypothetical protein